MAAATSACDFSAASLARAAGRRAMISVHDAEADHQPGGDAGDHRVGRVQKNQNHQEQRREGGIDRQRYRAAGDELAQLLQIAHGVAA